MIPIALDWAFLYPIVMTTPLAWSILLIFNFLLSILYSPFNIKVPKEPNLFSNTFFGTKVTRNTLFSFVLPYYIGLIISAYFSILLFDYLLVFTFLYVILWRFFSFE